MPLSSLASMRRRVAAIPLASVVVLLAAAPASAAAASTDTHAEPSVEFPVWSDTWVGTLGNRHIEVALSRTADTLTGTYCYAPCATNVRYRLSLQGSVDPRGASLSERDIGAASNPERVTGTWKMDGFNDTASGTWTSPDGKRTLPVSLARKHDGKRFPYDVHLVANALPGNGSCDDTPHVTAIRLYDHARLVQTLATDSQGTCGIFTPEFDDVNFDGWPDLMLAQSMGAGPDIPYQTWIFDPKTRRFVDAPPKLQAITSPSFDPVHRIVWTSWRASAAEHGVTTYRWQGNDVKEIDTATSYLLPVLDGNTRRYCYITPSYGDGFIEFPQRIEQIASGSLRATLPNPKDCETDDSPFLSRTYIDIWKAGAAGHAPVLVRTEAVTWKPAQTRAGRKFCPDVPFYDNGRIRRILLRDDPDQCSDTNPDKG
ncbi:nitrite reductase [Burkholderia anthina]|uniref:XAC2610-related protein n=1 Tax=Burkholderia anthina TaxID=179879 RepID=UPI001CF113D0|nr:nitrite reductase [Burkholderia anthina]MCA8089396.1 nitrite reductase [Burkholderia anthina]